MNNNDALGLAFGLLCFAFIVYIVVIIFFVIIPLMKIFEKAGQPGWMAWVPILNSLILAHIVGRPAWWGIIPILNFIVLFELAKAFGKSDGFGIGLVLLGPIFIPMLGYGAAQYQLEQKPPLF